MKKIRALIPLLLWLAMSAAFGQLQVQLKMSRSMYMVYEPTLAQVFITNLSGRDLNLEDSPGHPWFSFEIFAGVDSLIPPNDPDYHIPPLYIPSGQTVNRTINLTPLYSLQDFGPHSVKAVIYVKDQDKYYTSNRKAIEITEGLRMWSQSVGAAPEDGGGTLIWSLLSHRLPDKNELYVRLMDQDHARVIACFGLGTIITFSPPTYQLDGLNQLHVLQMVGPSVFQYTCIDLHGQVVSRESYFTGKTSSPQLIRESSGIVDVKGGIKDVPVAPGKKSADAPKLSDRPVPVPR